MERLHAPGDRVGPYRIATRLGRGAFGSTFEAEDLRTHRCVALKAMSLAQVTDWKLLELFEREAEILAQLDHPRIPQYLDHFQLDVSGDRRFYLVQALAPGRSLAALVEGGWRAREAAAEAIARQVLEILVYLHGQVPPVIHRDLKPQNLLYTESGQISLVDFGAVQAAYRHTLAPGTFVGTFGYMPPEQFGGHVSPAADLYALGATVLFALSGKSPAELPKQRLRVQFRQAVAVSPRFANWLDQLLAPAVEDRVPSATAALTALDAESEPRSLVPPQYSSRLETTQRQLAVEFPSQLRSRRNLVRLVPLALWTVLLGGFAFGGGATYLLVVWALVEMELIGYALGASVGRLQLTLDRRRVRLRWNFLGFSREFEAQTASLAGLAVGRTSLRLEWSDRPARTYSFGAALDPEEQEWLRTQIQRFLQQARSLSVE